MSAVAFISHNSKSRPVHLPNVPLEAQFLRILLASVIQDFPVIISVVYANNNTIQNFPGNKLLLTGSKAQRDGLELSEFGGI